MNIRMSGVVFVGIIALCCAATQSNADGGWMGVWLSFQLKRLDASSPLMDFTVTLTAPGSARIHCLNCGDDAPVVEMTRED